jgi:hypothetical protein
MMKTMDDDFYVEDETPGQRAEAWRAGEPVVIIPLGPDDPPADPERTSTWT